MLKKSCRIYVWKFFSSCSSLMFASEYGRCSSCRLWNFFPKQNSTFSQYEYSLHLMFENNPGHMIPAKYYWNFWQYLTNNARNVGQLRNRCSFIRMKYCLQVAPQRKSSGIFISHDRGEARRSIDVRKLPSIKYCMTRSAILLNPMSFRIMSHDIRSSQSSIMAL